MNGARVKDWLIGATGMVLVLVAALVTFGWAVSSPAGESEAGRAPSPTPGAEDMPGRQPPTDLGQGEVWLADLALDVGTVVTADSRLRDVRAVGHHVATRPEGLVAARVTVDATVPFEVVAEELGGGSRVQAGEGGQATVVRTVEALGRELRVVATGTVQAEAGRLVVEPTSIDIGGPDFLADALAAAVRRFVTIEHDIEGLPEGLTLQKVAVRADGFRVRLRGEEVNLAP